MALLYNLCSYNGGKYQATAWDICCPEWESDNSTDPAEFTCDVHVDAVFNCKGIFASGWSCGAFEGDWQGTGINAQGWSCYDITGQVWVPGGINPQPWAEEDRPLDGWICNSGTNPQPWGAEEETADWEDVPPPAPVEYQPYIRRDQEDCGN